MRFYSALGRGGFLADDVFNFSGPQLFSYLNDGSIVFTPGSYQLVETPLIDAPTLKNALTLKTDTVTLTELFTDPPPDPPTVSIPEPSTWAMLLLGFVGLGFAGYRKATTRITG